jgi:hypothetical protein
MLPLKNMSLQKYINDSSKPLIFLGSNSIMYKFTEVCDMVGIKVAGLIDSNYFGNTEEICEVPVIDTELCLEDSTKLEYYKKNFNFFCAVNWTPEKTPVMERNQNKRWKLLELIHRYNLPCISIVDPDARISKNSTIGYGCFVDAHVMIEPLTTVGNFTNIYYNTILGHNNTVGNNCVFQRQVMLTGGNTVGDNCYFALAVKFMKFGATAGNNTFIQEGIYLRRGTVENEIVSEHGGNQSRVRTYPTV